MATRSHWLTASSFGWVLPLIVSCHTDEFSPPPRVESSQLYWDLELNHHAVTMSMDPLYDTLRLVAVPRNVDAEPLPDLPTPQYTSRNPERVVVQSDGVLRALAPTGDRPVVVVATLTAGNLKHTDSLFVKVLGTTPWGLQSFTIHQPPPDSAKWSEFNANIIFSFLSVLATDSSGAPINDLLTWFRSSNPEIATVEPLTGQVRGMVPGTLDFIASATAFGVRKVDTLPYRIGFPVAVFDFQLSPLGTRYPTLTIGTGGIVQFGIGGYQFEDTSLVVDVTFTDPTNVVAADVVSMSSFVNPGLIDFYCSRGMICNGAGNFVLRPAPTDPAYQTFDSIGAVLRRTAALRRFPVPGIYDFHSATLGVSSRIVVKDEHE